MSPHPLEPPPFSRSVRATNETARNDKIELSVGAFRLHVFNVDDIQNILRHLGPPPVQSSGSRVREDLHGIYSWMFNTSTYQPTSSRRVVSSDFRRGKLKLSERPQALQPPLIKGRCEWRINRGTAIQPETTGTLLESGELAHDTPVYTDCAHGHIDATLHLIANPTRYFRYQAGQPTQPFPDAMTERPGVPTGLSPETAYDGNDNWIPFTNLHLTELQQTPWRRVLNRYINGIEAAFVSEFTRANDLINPGVMIATVQKAYNVQDVETYWEWTSPEPLKLVRDLMPLFMAYSDGLRTSRKYISAISGVEHDCPFIQTEISPGETLKIYAKTDRRIRFEVRHTFKGRKPFKFPRMSDESGRISRSARHTFETLPATLNLFDNLRDRATEVVNDLLTHLDENHRFAPAGFAPYTALMNISTALRDYPDEAQNILSILISNGAVAGGGENSHKAAIEALKQAKILKTTGRGLYMPTPRYREAFRFMGNQLNPSTLFTPMRSRVRRVVLPPAAG